MRVRSGCKKLLQRRGRYAFTAIYTTPLYPAAERHDVHATVTIGPVLIIMIWVVIVAVDGVVFGSKCKSGSGCESGPGS